MVLRNCYKSQEKGRQDDKVDIKWEESFIACVESDLSKEILIKHLWNPETPKNMRGGRIYGNTRHQLNKY